MDDNNLLMIILAFVVGFMLQGMMKNMCGGRLVEGKLLGPQNKAIDECCTYHNECHSGNCSGIGTLDWGECTSLRFNKLMPPGKCKP